MLEQITDTNFIKYTVAGALLLTSCYIISKILKTPSGEPNEIDEPKPISEQPAYIGKPFLVDKDRYSKFFHGGDCYQIRNYDDFPIGTILVLTVLLDDGTAIAEEADVDAADVSSIPYLGDLASKSVLAGGGMDLKTADPVENNSVDKILQQDHRASYIDHDESTRMNSLSIGRTDSSFDTGSSSGSDSSSSSGDF